MAKQVVFQGMHYEVPDWARWIAQDRLGAIRVYASQPYLEGDGWCSTGQVKIVGGARAPLVLEAIL